MELRGSSRVAVEDNQAAALDNLVVAVDTQAVALDNQAAAVDNIVVDWDRSSFHPDRAVVGQLLSAAGPLADSLHYRSTACTKNSTQGT